MVMLNGMEKYGDILTSNSRNFFREEQTGVRNFSHNIQLSTYQTQISGFLIGGTEREIERLSIVTVSQNFEKFSLSLSSLPSSFI